MARGIDNKYTHEMKVFISDNQFGISRSELTEQFNKRYKTSLSVDAINGYCKRNHLQNGFTGRFPKGNIPMNKNVKMSESVYKKCKATMFKKGNIPNNHRAVGSERVNDDGYIEVKVAEHRRWRLKHNVIWENVNGEIPKDSAVIFLDRNKLNVDISNLKLIERKDLLTMNRQKMFNDNAELTEIATNVAKLINATNSCRKKRNTILGEVAK